MAGSLAREKTIAPHGLQSGINRGSGISRRGHLKSACAALGSALIGMMRAGTARAQAGPVEVARDLGDGTAQNWLVYPDRRQVPVGCRYSVATGECVAPGATEEIPAPGQADAVRLTPARLEIILRSVPQTQRVMQDLVFPAFMQRHPGITIDYSPADESIDRILTRYAGGETPDVFLAPAAGAPTIAEGKLALPLDDRIRGWEVLEDFFPAALTSSQWNGLKWGLPAMAAPRTYIWRRNVLTEAGISKIPSTWEEVAEAARRSTKVEAGAIVRAGFAVPDAWTMFAQCLLTTGKTLFRNGKAEFAGAEGIAALEYYLDIYRGIRPPGAEPPTGGGGIISGEVGHTWSNTWWVARVAESSLSDLAQIEVGDPAIPGGGKYVLPSGVPIQPVSTNFSDFIVLGSLSKAPDQAWALMQFLVEPEPLTAYVASESFQVQRKSLADKGFMRQPHVQRLIQIFDKYGQAQIRVPNQPLFLRTLRAMGDDIFNGRASPGAAAEQAARVLQAEVDRLGFRGTTL